MSRQKDERNPINYLLYSRHSCTIINPHMTFTPVASSGLQSAVRLLVCQGQAASSCAPGHCCWDMSWSGSQLHSIVSILPREQNQDGQDQFTVSEFSIPDQTKAGARWWLVDTCVSVQSGDNNNNTAAAARWSPDTCAPSAATSRVQGQIMCQVPNISASY